MVTTLNDKKYIHLTEATLKIKIPTPSLVKIKYANGEIVTFNVVQR